MERMFMFTSQEEEVEDDAAADDDDDYLLGGVDFRRWRTRFVNLNIAVAS